MHDLFILIVYTAWSMYGQFCSSIEQASYYYQRFYSDTVFLHRDIAPNKYNIQITLLIKFNEVPAAIMFNISS